MRLHLGCGGRYIPGWVHLDAHNHAHVDIVHTVQRLDMFEDASADEIYACHILEHFPRTKTRAVLAEWCRVLRRGGRLRVAVPWFERLIDVYRATGDLGVVIGPLMGRQDSVLNIHYNIFDVATLERDMTSAGLAQVARYRWQDTDHADVDDYAQAYIPHMDRENGVLISLNMEGYKP